MFLKKGLLLQGEKYKIERVLGQGGFGITYLAEQTSLRREVAIKEFFMKELCNRDETTSHVSVGSEGSREMVTRFREKFVKEARNIARLEHPNIVSVIDVFEENGTAYYVMKYCDGGSLAELLKTQYPSGMPEAMALKYIREVASALDYIHKRSINHLDVKPSNIMLNESGNAVLIDFGLSKQYDTETGQQTSTTPVGISEGYAPMEQYKKGGVGKFSPSTDIYSLGATLYKLITGNTPPSALDLGVEPLPEFMGTSHVKEAVCSAMKTRSTDRPQNISAFLSVLEGDSENTYIVPEPASKATHKPIPAPTPLPKPLLKLKPIFFGFIAMAVIVLSIMFFGRDGKGEDPIPPTSSPGFEEMTDSTPAELAEGIFPNIDSLAETKADVTFKASAPSTVAVGQKFRLVYTANARANDISVDLENHGFKVLYGPSDSTSSSRSINKGQLTSEFRTTFVYVLLAEKVGTFTLPAATCKADGQTVTSNKLTIKVLPADTKTPQGSNNNKTQTDKNKMMEDPNPVIVQNSTEGTPEPASIASGTHLGHDWVDLGLPSGTKWATTNIGANSPSDYGSYFAWGETSPKREYTWKNLKYRTSGEKEDAKFSKYIIENKYGSVDDMKELELSDDAAYVNWGSGWRTPSVSQIEELKSNCTSTWMTINGKKGMLFSSKKNDNSIFLPASGYRIESIKNQVGSHGLYWSRSLSPSHNELAYFVNVNSSFPIMIYLGSREVGHSVRPVHE